MENYTIISCSTHIELMIRVNKSLAMGYMLAGGICVNNGYYYQALYKSII